MQTTPRVAILIPAFNASLTVARAVTSALREPETAEVVVVDDGSTDDTLERAHGADDGSGRLRLVRQPNRGPSAALNRAHAESRAPYVGVLDSDDFFVAGRLAKLFDREPGWDFVADRLLLAREGAEDGPYELWEGRLPADGRLEFAAFVAGNISDPKRPRTELGFIQPIYRRAFIDNAGLRYDEDLRLGEDFIFYAEALAAGARFHTLDQPGYVAVARAGSLSHRHKSSDLRALLDADERLARHPKLTPAERDVVARHSAQVRRRWVYHHALELKAQHGIGAAVRGLLDHANHLPYVLAETVRARLPKAAPKPARTLPCCTSR